MGEVVSLEEYKAKHHPAYIRGIILDSKTPRAWSKEESDEKVKKARQLDNERVKASYKVGKRWVK
jgi:hypothetical protein